jgi:hypothetical protein
LTRRVIEAETGELEQFDGDSGDHFTDFHRSLPLNADNT